MYVVREATREVLIIDSFTVPKSFEEKGLTGEVMANRIGDTIVKIEGSISTRMKKDALGRLRDEDSYACHRNSRYKT